MSSDSHLIDTIADWVMEAQEATPPQEVDVHIRRALLDYGTAVIAGSGAPTAGAMRGHVLDGSDGGRASASGMTETVSASDAALVNGTAAHSLRVDDGYTLGAVHPGAAVTPAVLAVAEREGRVSGRLAMTAVALGTEIACRLGAAADRDALRLGRPAATVPEAIGAAIGGAVAIGADRDATAAAIALSANHACGGESNRPGLDAARVGLAARAGVISIDAAMTGKSGPSATRPPSRLVFDAQGFDRAFALEGLGERWETLRTYLKPYPGSRHVHGPIELALELTEGAPIELDAVDSVTVITYETAARQSSVAHGVENLRASIPHAIAVALRDGDVGIAALDSEPMNESLRSFYERVTVQAEASMSARYPYARPAELRLKLCSGRSSRAAVDTPYGEPDRPLSTTDLMAKFEALCSPVIDIADRHRMVTMIAQTFSVAEFASVLRFEAPEAEPGTSPAPAT